MKAKILFWAIVILIAIQVNPSCKKITCENCNTDSTWAIGNKAPIAIAGPDQVIPLPIANVLLDGSASNDPDGTITTWLWRSIGNLARVNFDITTNSKVTIDSLVSGIFLFELKITDNKGYNSFDTVQVIVNGPDCIISGRPLIYPQLIEIGTLSETRQPVAAAAGNKVVFAGGYSFACGPDWSNVSSAVDIYDVVTGTWTTSRLSVPRMEMTTVAAGNKIFFAGGRDFWVSYDNIDIYDVITNTWTVAHLPRPEAYLSAAALGNKIFFAGGFTDNVDIYNLSTNTWSTASLSVARSNFAMVTAGNKIYFAGGIGSGNTSINIIDIYDNSTNTWTTSRLQELKGDISGISAGDKIFWTKDNRVEILNTTNGVTNFECLSGNYSSGVLKRNDDIIFISGILYYADFFNIYNTGSGSWSQGQLKKNFAGAAIINGNNKIYAAGAFDGSTDCQSNKVYMINW